MLRQPLRRSLVRPLTVAATAAVLLLGAAACGGGDEDTAGSSSASSAAAASGAAAPGAGAPAAAVLPANTATEAELMTIPGVGENIAHEITEYRPYDAETGPQKFRDEMKKYIDDAEIERIMHYLDFGA